MQEIHLTTREAILYLALIGAGIGLVFGLVPLILGWIMGKKRLGLIGLIVSTVAGGAISWFISPLVMVIFIFLIIRKSPLDSTSDAPDSDALDDDDTAL
jgi:Na+/melibiose symporter-like transporter